MTLRSWWNAVRRPRQLSGGLHEADGEWMLLVSTWNPSLAGMYLDLLAQAGIAVRTSEWGGGSAVIGGVPQGTTIYVREDCYLDAAALLAPAINDEDTAHE